MTTCPTCGASVSGKFCRECGTPLTGAKCPSCDAPLTPGAKFCHRCGISVVAVPSAAAASPPVAATSGFGNALPWAVAAIAVLSLIALAAGQRFARTGALPGSSPQASAAGRSAPDISSMTPQERAERLYDRIMNAAQAGHVDSARFFMPMAVQSYGALAPLTVDQRYDLGRLGEVTGDANLAAAQADSILKQNPQHLLGLVLAYRSARLRGDNASAARSLRQLARVEAAERRKQLPEYLLRQADIEAALRDAEGIR